MVWWLWGAVAPCWGALRPHWGEHRGYFLPRCEEPGLRPGLAGTGSFTQVVTRISPRVLLQIVLVIILGWRELPGLRDFRDDRGMPSTISG
jgi:hypothetical protein